MQGWEGGRVGGGGVGRVVGLGGDARMGRGQGGRGAWCRVGAGRKGGRGPRGSWREGAEGRSDTHHLGHRDAERMELLGIDVVRLRVESGGEDDRDSVPREVCKSRKSGAVALTLGSVPRRTVFKLRQFHLSFIFNNQTKIPGRGRGGPAGVADLCGERRGRRRAARRSPRSGPEPAGDA